MYHVYKNYLQILNEYIYYVYDPCLFYPFMLFSLRFQTTERKFKEAKKFIKEISEENAKLVAELNRR